MQFEQSPVLCAAPTIDFRQITDPFAAHAGAVVCNQIGFAVVDVAAINLAYIAKFASADIRRAETTGPGAGVGHAIQLDFNRLWMHPFQKQRARKVGLIIADRWQVAGAAGQQQDCCGIKRGFPAPH